MPKQTARIENWWVCECYGGSTILIGEIKDHPRQNQFYQKEQQTSRIINLDREKGICETANTIYTLGKEAELTNGQA